MGSRINFNTYKPTFGSVSKEAAIYALIKEGLNNKSGNNELLRIETLIRDSNMQAPDFEINVSSNIFLNLFRGHTYYVKNINTGKVVSSGISYFKEACDAAYKAQKDYKTI